MKRKNESQPAQEALTSDRTPAGKKRYGGEKLAAQYIDKSVKTLQRWRCTGEGPRFARLGKRGIIYDFDDLDSYIESRKIQSTSAHTEA